MDHQKDFGGMMQGCMLDAVARVAKMMMLEAMLTIVPQARERLAEALGHEPTHEDWEDYYGFLGERAADPKCLHRAGERARIRGLVLGKDHAGSGDSPE